MALRLKEVVLEQCPFSRASQESLQLGRVEQVEKVSFFSPRMHCSASLGLCWAITGSGTSLYCTGFVGPMLPHPCPLPPPHPPLPLGHLGAAGSAVAPSGSLGPHWMGGYQGNTEEPIPPAYRIRTDTKVQF